MTAPTGTRAVDRAAGLLAAVVQADSPVPFVQLQVDSGLPKSTTSRLLAALERTELLERDQTGSYLAGPLFWLYAARHDPWDELVRLAQPAMERIGAETMESVHLAVARGDRVVQLAQVDSQFILGSSRDWSQIDVPDHCSALGKVLYAYECLPVPNGEWARPTEHSLSRDELIGQLRTYVRHGWAATVDELEIGLCGVAVPVRGAAAEVVATIGISGPTARLSGHLEEIARLLAGRAEGLSRRLRRRSRKDGAA